MHITCFHFQYLCIVMCSLVVFDPDYDPTRYKSAIVFNRIFFETLSVERRLEKKFWPILAHCESGAHNRNIAVFRLGFGLLF